MIEKKVKTRAFINGKIVLPNGIAESGCVVFDDKISDVILDADMKNNPQCRADEVIDLKGRYLMPGLVDIHIHGYKGFDVSDGDRGGILNMSRCLVENGVTAWCPTTMTVAEEEIQASLDIIGSLRYDNPDNFTDTGARILGANLEGPFINPKKKGAQATEYIKKPDTDFVMKNRSSIKLLTVAPETDDCGFIKYISENTDILISLGHTAATYEQTIAGITDGARHATHLFNAMPPLNHREPGVIGAVLENTEVSCEMIADTFHISPHMFGIVEKLKGEKLVLITDCMRAGGMPDGSYTLGGQQVNVKGKKCLLKDGTIAGSVLKLNEAVKNFKEHAKLPLHKAVAAASLYPAAAIGMADVIGSVEVGKYADFAIADEDMNIMQTYIGGELRNPNWEM